MKLYLWNHTYPVSGEWHNGGGVLILAENRDAAQDKWVDYCKEWGLDDSSAVDEAPDGTFEVSGWDAGPDEVWVFEDAGCC